MCDIDIMLTCCHCDERVPPYDTAMQTWQAWRCPHCGGWTNWMKTTTEDDDAMGNVTQRGNSPFCTPRSLQHIVNRTYPVVEADDKAWRDWALPKGHDWPVLPGIPVAPGEGKSKGLKKLMKKINKREKKLGRKKFKWTTFKAAKTKPSDLLGYLVPINQQED